MELPRVDHRQSRSSNDQQYQPMRSNPAASPSVEQVLAIATFAPGMYEVVKIYVGPSEPAR